MRFIPLLIGVAAVAASAYDSGRQSGRWQKLTGVDTVAERLKNVPSQVGDWRADERTMDPHELEVAGVVQYVSRLYTNRKTGDRVQILLICGRPGPIAAHPPEVCYASAGYVPEKQAERVAIGSDEFKAGKFVKSKPRNDALKILWAWSTDGDWKAPDYPRQAFGRSTTALFKLYVIRQVPSDEAAGSKDPSVEFLDVMLPALKQCLAPAA